MSESQNLGLRSISLLAYSLLGANAAALAGRNPLEGIPAAMVIEALPHTPFSNGIAGGAAVTAAHVPLALGGFSLEGLIDYIKNLYAEYLKARERDQELARQKAAALKTLQTGLAARLAAMEKLGISTESMYYGPSEFPTFTIKPIVGKPIRR